MALFTLLDLQNRLSAEGVALRLDDAPPSELGDIQEDVGSVVDEHCLLAYTAANLLASRWVKQRSIDVGVVLLAERRGNDGTRSMMRKHDRAMERFELVRLGKLLIPDIPQRKAGVPVLSNVRVRLDPFPRTVVEPSRSTGTAEGYRRHRDRFDYWDYTL